LLDGGRKDALIYPYNSESEKARRGETAAGFFISKLKTRRATMDANQSVAVFDTTLRDGEQAAGTRLGSREKLAIAEQLGRLGVDVIEAGFPCSSPEDFASVELIAAEVKGPVICGLSRAVLADIDACGQALAGAHRSRIHTGLGVSDIHIAGKFRDERYGHTLAYKKEQVLAMAVAAVRHAADQADEVEFYAEDAGRAERDFLARILTEVAEAGATVVNIPDTTGYSVPQQYEALIHELRRILPALVTLSVHCHDDLGMAVANTLAGVAGGARQVEGTINGVGERAGNAALEEVVMTLQTRRDFYGLDTGINSRELCHTSRMVAGALGMRVAPNKAVVGRNAFAHSSGIHVDGVLKNRETYEIMRPEDVGMEKSRVVLTARTGRHGLQHRLAELGHDVSESALEQIYKRFLKVADRKQEIVDEELLAIVSDEIRPTPVTFRLDHLQATSETGTTPIARVRIHRGESMLTGEARGDGPVDAVYKAIEAAVGMKPHLKRYEIEAVTGGTEALGQVTVLLATGDGRVMGQGASTDIIEASAKAYLDALNRLIDPSRGLAK
jgi:2-isopropylmalate synthase